MVLWRHECSRYASSSRIGYHPNHPSASHPSSRPSSAATILRPFSAGRVSQQSSKQYQHLQRASSALPRRPASHREGAGDSGASWNGYNADAESGLPAAGASGRRIRGGSRNRPRSAIPRLGAGTGAGGTDDDEDEPLVAGAHPERGFSASSARGEDDVGEGDGILATGGRRSRSTSARSRSPMDRRTNLALEGGYGEEGDEFLDEIYEDLDDEDDGELDNRISIMESRFSTVGRERRPGSAVGDGGANGDSDPVGITDQRQRRSDPQRATASAGIPRSATSQRPPRAPLQQQRQMSAGSRTTRRQHASSSAARTRTAGHETGDGGNSNSATTQQLRPSHLPSTATRDSSRPPRVIRSRPTSAPVDGSVFGQEQRGGHGGRDPMAPLHARWRRLQMSAGARNGDGTRAVAEVEHGLQQRTRPVRDVSGY